MDATLDLDICDDLYNSYKLLKVTEIKTDTSTIWYYIYVYANHKRIWSYVSIDTDEHNACIELLKGLYPHITPRNLN